MGTLFVGETPRIRKFTQAAVAVLNVIPMDEGRPLEHIAATLPGLNLVAMTRRVIATSTAELHVAPLRRGQLGAADGGGGRWVNYIDAASGAGDAAGARDAPDRGGRVALNRAFDAERTRPAPRCGGRALVHRDGHVHVGGR